MANKNNLLVGYVYVFVGEDGTIKRIRVRKDLPRESQEFEDTMELMLHFLHKIICRFKVEWPEPTAADYFTP